MLPRSEIGRRIRMLFQGARFNRELEEEMQLHVQLREAKLRCEGLCERDARQEARRRFGGALRLRERSVDVWRWRWLDDLGRDLGYRRTAAPSGATVRHRRDVIAHPGCWRGPVGAACGKRRPVPYVCRRGCGATGPRQAPISGDHEPISFRVGHVLS